MVGTISTKEPLAWEGQALQRSSKTVVFADVVDSVRLIESDEEGTVRRWLGFVDSVETEVGRSKTGRVVKRLGDGVMMEFGDACEAVQTALQMRSRLAAVNQSDPAAQGIDIRIGMHAGEVLRSLDADLYGRDVNIAARLADATMPGEIMASASVRDALANSVDAEFEDVGPVFLKNVPQPVHTFRVVAPHEFPRVAPLLAPEDLLPTIAVLPLVIERNGEAHVWRDLLTEDIITALSRSHQMNVISRLSTMGISPGIPPSPRTPTPASSPWPTRERRTPAS